MPQFNQIAGVFMAKLSSRYYPLFEEVGTEFVIRSGNVLYMQGDHSSNLYLVKSGRLGQRILLTLNVLYL